jgi:hypothetical protein
VQVALNETDPPLPAIVFVVVLMLPLPLAAWQVLPLEAAQVQVQPDRPAGNVSLSATPADRDRGRVRHDDRVGRGVCAREP